MSGRENRNQGGKRKKVPGHATESQFEEKKAPTKKGDLHIGKNFTKRAI